MVVGKVTEKAEYLKRAKKDIPVELIKLKDGKPKEVISKRRNSKKSESFNVIF